MEGAPALCPVLGHKVREEEPPRSERCTGAWADVGLVDRGFLVLREE